MARGKYCRTQRAFPTPVPQGSTKWQAVVPRRSVAYQLCGVDMWRYQPGALVSDERTLPELSHSTDRHHSFHLLCASLYPARFLSWGFLWGICGCQPRKFQPRKKPHERNRADMILSHRNGVIYQRKVGRRRRET